MMRALQQLIVKQKLPIQLGDWAFLQAHYEAASLQQGGRVIKPPRYRWYLYEGVCESNLKLTIDISDPVAKEQLMTGLRSNESFECASLGMFYKRDGRFELLLSKGTAYQTGPNYGLPSLNLQLVKTHTAAQVVPLSAKKQSKNLWWLQVAATVLFIVFLNVLALNYLSENGGLSFKQAVKVSLFDSLKEPDPFRYNEDSLEEIGFRPELRVESEPTVSASGVVDTAITTALMSQEVRTVAETPAVPSEKVDDKVATVPAFKEKSNTPTTKSEVSDARLKVVVGAFGMEGNAFKFAAELQKKGYKTQVLQPVKGSLFRVVVLPTADEVGEEALLKQVQENIHPQAWILAE